MSRTHRLSLKALQSIRYYSTPTTTPTTSPFAPRHFLSIADLSSAELTTLVRNAHSHKVSMKSNSIPKSLIGALSGQNIALMFNKRSTRTRVSTESAIAKLSGSSMFLGKEDIQLGVNESLYDSSIVISSMVSAIVARVAAHSDIAELAKHSSVPVINALSNDFHPMQTIADILTMVEALQTSRTSGRSVTPGLGLEGTKIAWVGDSNNVLFDLMLGASKLGIDVAVASPKGYEVPNTMRELIEQSSTDARRKGEMSYTNIPEEAVKSADVMVTDTWVSMGQEAEKKERLRVFDGFRVTSDLARRGGAKEDWKFMHCLPRHPEEVEDAVFYHPTRSLVFTEAENRLWAAIAVLEAFVVNKGKIL